MKKSNDNKEEIRMLEDKIVKLDEKFSLIKDYPIAAHQAISNFYFKLAEESIHENKIIEAHKDLIEYLEELLIELKERLNKGFNEFLTKDFKEVKKPCWICEDRERNFIGDECEEHIATGYHRCMQCNKISNMSELDGTDNRGLRCRECRNY